MGLAHLSKRHNDCVNWWRSPRILACQKIFFQNYKISGWKPPFWGTFRGKIKILSIHISSVRNLQLSVGKLQLPASNLFNWRRCWCEHCPVAIISSKAYRSGLGLHSAVSEHIEHWDRV